MVSCSICSLDEILGLGVLLLAWGKEMRCLFVCTQQALHQNLPPVWCTQQFLILFCHLIQDFSPFGHLADLTNSFIFR